MIDSSMAGNSNLHAANKAKKDEFYTQLSDIANELKHYKQHFAGKTVFCNCDDPYESNFFKYFALNFNVLGLKKLIATCYDGSPVADTQMCLFEPDEPYGKPQKTRVPHKIVITEVPDANGDGATDLTDVEWLIKNDKNVLTTLQGNGDFRSPECVELLKDADIVVTNPPFSLPVPDSSSYATPVPPDSNSISAVSIHFGVILYSPDNTNRRIEISLRFLRVLPLPP